MIMQARSQTVHVIGASGRSGLALCRALLAEGYDVVPVARNAGRYEGTMARAGLMCSGEGRGAMHPVRIVDIATAPTPVLAGALADATTVVCTAHARNVPSVLAALPPAARLMCLGSTRKFTRWPDAHGNGVLLGERALLASGRPGVILHPTMIYGADGENNVQRLAALLRRLPVVPLPGGGRSLVQPIHQSDVSASLMAAIRTEWSVPTSMVIAGASAVSYREFIRMIERAAGIGRRPILPVPSAPLIALSALTRFLPGVPSIGPAEVRRLLEDKAFDITPMRSVLGVSPLTLDVGLARLFAGPDSGLGTPAP